MARDGRGGRGGRPHPRRHRRPGQHPMAIPRRAPRPPHHRQPPRPAPEPPGHPRHGSTPGHPHRPRRPHASRRPRRPPPPRPRNSCPLGTPGRSRLEPLRRRPSPHPRSPTRGIAPARPSQAQVFSTVRTLLSTSSEDHIPEILAEQRLGHEVPGMRGLYAHVTDPMRDQLKAALQTRWEDSLRARIAIYPRSPLPLLDQLLTHATESSTEPTSTAA